MKQHSLGGSGQGVQTIYTVEVATTAHYDSCNRSDADAYFHSQILCTKRRLPLFALDIMEKGFTSHLAHGEHQVKAQHYHVVRVAVNIL